MDDPPEPVVTDLAAGVAAEHLVCADLLLAGYNAFMTDQFCSYDLAVDVDGRLVRVQVKSTRRPRIVRPTVVNAAYLWHVRRSGKNGAREYADDAFDLLALVALDIRRVAYLPLAGAKQTTHIRPPGTTGGRQFDDLSFERALLTIQEPTP